MATFDNVGKAGDGVRAAADWLKALSERSLKAATGAAERSRTARAVEGATKLAARGVDDAHLAFRDVLHTVEAQDVFRGLTPEAQNKIIANAAETNRLLAEELKQVQSTEPGTKVKTFSARDSDAPSQEDVLRRIHGMRQELAPVSKTYDTQPTPAEMGERRRLAGPTMKTEMRDAKTGEPLTQTDKTPRPDNRTWLDRVSGEDGGDIQTRTALPEVPGGDLRKVQEIKPTRYASDMKKTLDATVNPQEINNLLAEVMTAHLNNPEAGILQPDDLRALQPHFKSLAEKKKGAPEDQLTLGSVAQVLDNAITRIRGKTNLSESEAALREKGLAWQANQTLYKPDTNQLRSEVNLEPRDKSNLQVAQDRAGPFLGTGVTAAPDSKIKQQVGGDAIVEGDKPTPTSSRSGGAAASKPTQQVLESLQHKRTPLAQHLMTADNPDGTLKYPHQALQTALEDVSRLEENTNWHSFEAAIARSLDYINAQRKSAGLPPARLGVEFDKYLAQKQGAVGDRIASDGAAANGASVDEREVYSKRVFNALSGIRKGLEQGGAKNPVSFDSVVRDADGNIQYFTFPNQARAVDPATMSPVPASNPAGEVKPGTARNPSNVPPAPKNVAPRPAAPVASDISTDKHIADVVAGKREPTEALVEALQARQNAIDAKRQRGDGAGADADQKALDEQTAGWNWKGTEAPAPKQGDAEALPEVPASIDLGTPKKGRGKKATAKPAPTAPKERTAAELTPEELSKLQAFDLPDEEIAKLKGDQLERTLADIADFEKRSGTTVEESRAAQLKSAGIVGDSPADPPAVAPTPAKKRGRRTTDATPVEPPAAAKPEPAKAPESRETMELAAKQMGMTPEEVAGMDDPTLYKRLTEKAASGQEPFKGGDPRFVKRKYSTGEVSEGDNLPDVPSQKVLDAGTKGEIIPSQPSVDADEILPPKEKAKPEPIDGEWSDVPRLGYKPEPKRNPNTAPERGPIEVKPKPGQFAADDTNWQMPKKPSRPGDEPVVPKADADAAAKPADTTTPKDDAELARAEKFARNTAIGVGATTAGGLVIANARRKPAERPDPSDILGPTYQPQPSDTKHPIPGSGGRRDQAGSDAPSPAAQSAHVDPPMADSPREQQPDAALEAMKAEKVRQEVEARRAAVESTLRRIGNVRGMGTYGPAFY